MSGGRAPFDRDLAGLEAGARWREWMARIEAVLFASPGPVARGDLARVVGRGASVDLLVADLRDGLRARPYDVVAVAGGYALRTRARYGGAIRAAGHAVPVQARLADFDAAVLAAVAQRQPVGRDGLRDIFGRDVPRALIARLRAAGLIAPGPRSPRPGAPGTFITTAHFLSVFGLDSLRDLPGPDDPDDPDDDPDDPDGAKETQRG